MPLSVRVQDVVHGTAASGAEVRLEARDGAGWREVATVAADDDGLVAASAWGAGGPAAGTVRVAVDAGRFFASLGLACAQAEVSTSLRLAGPSAEHRVDVLLAPSACTVHTAVTTSPTTTSPAS